MDALMRPACRFKIPQFVALGETALPRDPRGNVIETPARTYCVGRRCDEVN
jgi:hypothetical protein